MSKEDKMMIDLGYKKVDLDFLFSRFWEQMCKMKDIFWRDDEVCMQLHPKKEDYVNCMQYCLHIWRPIDKEIPMPPSIMVGLRKGKETEDLLDFLTFYDEMPKWE